MFKRIYTIIKRRVKRKLTVAIYKKPKIVRASTLERAQHYVDNHGCPTTRYFQQLPSQSRTLNSRRRSTANPSDTPKITAQKRACQVQSAGSRDHSMNAANMYANAQVQMKGKSQ